jgi:uncharacterized linocin/CFP29 family protein
VNLVRSMGPTIAIPVSRRLVTAVVDAINQLETNGQYGPFGCALGHGLYEAAHRPSPGSLVLPSDRFVPFLAGGPLLRSGVLPHDEGVIVATAGSPVDLVVASDVHVRFIQRTPEPRYVLRVSERLVLRIKQPSAVAHLVGQVALDAATERESEVVDPTLESEVTAPVSETS